ncbi:MAG: GlsB/YeaQ/YmgE family stress response membrane protein [Gammaproteobacteria bacterium]
MGTFIYWIVMGLIVGVLAKWIMPGKDPGGFFVTIGIGIAGAVVGGFIAKPLGFDGVTGFNLGSIAIATGGALVLLFAYRTIKSKRAGGTDLERSED